MADEEVKEPDRSPSQPITIRLRTPIQFGSDLVEELVLKPTARAFRDFSLPMGADGRVEYRPHPLACCGVEMAGKARALVDKMDPKDMSEVARAVMGFL